MKHKINICFLLAIVLLSLSCTGRGGYVRIEGYAQGGTYSVIFNTEGVDKAPTEIRDSVESILKKIVSTILGKEWLNKELFRFGVSRVANSLLAAVEQKTVSFF